MLLTSTDKRNLLLSLIYFAASTAITWWFVASGKALYASEQKMLLSTGIAGGKWGLQIGAALLFLNIGKALSLLRRLGIICLIGSAVLLPYCFAPLRHAMGSQGFFGSLLFSVLIMIPLYYRAVIKEGLPHRWFWAWMVCLAIAIALQCTVVFGLV